MRLLKMHADNFGRLHDFTFAFDNGLNVILEENGWYLLDLWDCLETERFTNSAIHYDAAGAAILADRVLEEINFILTNGPS